MKQYEIADMTYRCGNCREEIEALDYWCCGDNPGDNYDDITWAEVE